MKRPPGAPPTESLLETLMVQLCRRVPNLPALERQLRVGPYRLDLSLPDPGVFFELDGQQHKDQPVYDAYRETTVVALTGWPCGRFTWTDVTRLPKTTARRVQAIVATRRR
jgi:very-short-patch-repair endonuclease